MIAAAVMDAGAGDDEIAADKGQEILAKVLAEFRPDLFEEKNEEPSLPVLTYSEISTAHITVSDNRLLERDADLRLNAKRSAENLVVDSTPYGYFACVPEVIFAAQLLEIGYSHAFCCLLELARRQGLQILKFDCDGETVDGLPVFEW